MPIYAYKCESCGHRQDVLQKLSDPLLSTCPACGAASFVKQITAAGFQLKGSGWYATDFRNGSTPAAGDKEAKEAKNGKPDTSTPGDSAAGTAPATGDKAAPAPAASPAPSKPAKPADGGPAPASA
jgi:putative FmdB family regulatory protein